MMSCAVPPLPPPAPAPDIPPAAAPAPPVAAPAPAVIVPVASVVAMLVATEDTTLAPSVVATAGVAESMSSWTASSSSDVATTGAVTPAVVTVRFDDVVEVPLSTSKHSPSQHWPFTLIDCKNGAAVGAPTVDVAFLNVVDAMKPGVNVLWDNRASRPTLAVKTTLLPPPATLVVSGTPSAPVPDREKRASIARLSLNCSATVGGSMTASVVLVLVMLSREMYETRFVSSASTFSV